VTDDNCYVYNIIAHKVLVANDRCQKKRNDVSLLYLPSLLVIVDIFCFLLFFNIKRLILM